MKQITPSLKENQEGTEVKNLHHILFFLVHKLNNPNINQFFNQPGFQDAYKNEVFIKLYGSETLKLVNFLQDLLQVQQFEIGVVDNPTAEMFNRILIQFNGLELDKPEGYPYEVSEESDGNAFRISGTVTNVDKIGLSQISVMISEIDLENTTTIATTKTDERGSFSISFDYNNDLQDSDNQTNPDVIFQLFNPSQEEIAISRIFISSLASETPVDKLSDSKLAPIVLMNIPKEIMLRIVPDFHQRPLTEFEKTIFLLNPYMRQISFADLKEDEKNFQISFLNRESGIDKIIIEILKNAFITERNTQLPAWAFFGLDRLSFDYANSKNVTIDEMALLLRPLQPASSQDDLKIIAEKILAYSKEKTASEVAGSLKVSIGEILDPIVQAPEKVGKLLDAYARFEDDDITKFWERMPDDPDLAEIIPQVQYSLQLAQLTFNNVELMRSLQLQSANAKDLVKLDKDDWVSMIMQHEDKIPLHIEGETVNDKAENYAYGIHKFLELSFPKEFIIKSLLEEPEVKLNLLRRVASLNPEIDLVNDISADISFDSLNEDEKKEAGISIDKLRKEINAYPAYAEMLTKNKVLANLDIEQFPNTIRRDVDTFLTNNEAFNITQTPFDHFIKGQTDETWMGIEDRKAVSNQVRSMQRIHTVTASTNDMDILLGNGFHSAFEISQVPLEQFVEGMRLSLPVATATLYHQKASKITAGSTMLYHHLKELGLGVKPKVLDDVDGDGVADSIEPLKLIPEWEALFGSLDTCQCKDCLSVYSPAAYFVELLNIKTGLVKNKNVYTRLFERRLDLKHIKLSCENTNTLIPYIDLVNEILETYIATGSLQKDTTIDTSSFTALELAANAQHPNSPSIPPGVSNPAKVFEDAYNLLKNVNYPAGLPFDLPLETARKFLMEMGSSRYQVLKTFQKDEKLETLVSIEIEELEISAKEFEVLTGSNLDGSTSNFVQSEYEYYGYSELDIMPVLGIGIKSIGVEILQKKLNLQPTTVPKLLVNGNFDNNTELALKKFQQNLVLPETGKTDKNTWAFLFAEDNFAGEYLAHVKEFLSRTGILYTHLKDLLSTKFLNENKDIILALVIPDGLKDVEAWQSAHACDLGYTRLLHINGDVLTNKELSKFARFIRLWKNLTISIRELDIITTGLNVLDINHDLLLQLAKIIRMSTSLNIPFEQLMAFWANINTWENKSLYEVLFLNNAALQNDDIFLLNPTENQLLNTSEFVHNHIPALLAAFKVKEAELELIFDTTKIDSFADHLTLEVISNVYRHVLLAKAVKLSISDAVSLLKLTGVSPWGTVSSVSAFFALAEKVRQSGLKIPQLSYIYSHVADANSSYLPSPDAVLRIAQTLREGLLKIADETAVKDNAVNEEFFKSQIGIIFNGAQAGDLLATLKNNTLYEIALPLPLISNFDTFIIPLNTLANNYLISRFRYEGAKTKEKLIFQGAMTDIEKATLQNLSPDVNYKNAIDDLLRQPRKTLEHALSGFLNAADIKNLINNNATDADKFKVIYNQLHPFIKDSLNDTLIKQQLSNVLKTDTLVIEALLEISQNHWKDKIRKDILSLSQTGLWGTYFNSANTIKIEQVDKHINKNWALNSEDTTVIAPDQFKVIWSGKLEAPKTEAFTFIVKKDSDAILDLRINGQLLTWVTKMSTEWISETIALKTGTLQDIALAYTEDKNDASVALFWSSKTVPATLIPTENLYPSKPLEHFYHLFILLQKITTITETLKLKPDEIIYFSDNKTDFSSFDLSLLPTEKPNPYLPDAFNQFLELVDYKTLRDLLPVTESRLTDIFKAANSAFLYGASVKLLPPTTDIDDQKKLLFEHLIEEIIKITAWDQLELQTLIGNDILPLVNVFELKGGYFDVEPADFKNMSFLLRIWECLELASKIGVSTSKVGGWVDSPADFLQVQDIKRTLRAKFEETDWADVSKSVNDKLRVKQRDALVAYILTLPDIKAANIKDTNGLYSYFLIDVEMDACMQTSRIKQAISSVQLFIQRCLMNLEAKVSPAEINIKQWEWSKNYRVWEANRRVFLYPENWIEPELRDNKTPFFKELESELLQNEVNNDNVEKTLMNYLEKLGDVAKLDICGMCEDEEAKEVHVFGRTLNMPSIYYYRKLNQQTNVWTAWEKVQLDIRGQEDGDDTGVHLLPIVWNRRLYLFWPVFTEKAEAQTLNEKDFEIDAKSFWQIKLAWSEYRQKKWIPRIVSKQFLLSSVTNKDEERTTADIYVDSTRSNGIFHIYKKTFKFFRYLPKISNHFFEAEIHNGDLSISVKREYEQQVSGPSIDQMITLKFNEAHEMMIIKEILASSTTFSTFKARETCGKFTFSGCHNKVNVITNTKPSSQSLITPPGTINFYQEFASTNQLSEKLILTDIGKTPVPILGSSDGIYQLLKSNLVSNTGYYSFFYGDKSRVYYVNPEYYLQMEKGIKENNKTDFVTIEKAKTITNSLISKEKEIESVHQLQETAFLNPSLPTNVVATKLIANSLALTKTYLEAKPVMDYPSAIYKTFNSTKFTFHAHYHGYVCEFMKALNKGGIDELLTVQNQTYVDFFINISPFIVKNNFDIKYNPDTKNVASPTPVTHIEFQPDTAYGDYNWELFFHIPMLIANRLSKNQRFEEAKRWYEFVFNPTSNSPNNTTSRFWGVIPFMNTPNETIQELMNKLHSSNAAERNEIEDAIEAWRNNPFNPHLVARMRLIAYKKNTVMKYIDNLIAWGDQLFSRDTMESIKEATQLYIMAAEILGSYRQQIPARGQVSPKSFAELESTVDKFSNPLVKMETMFPFFNIVPVNNLGSLPPTVTNIVSTLYFCIPDNDKLLGYWDLVADRLFKIRHCQNIEGVERQLALFEPRIDPALLVQAVASGIDINSVLSDINAPLPHYRFNYLIEKALQMCGYLTSLANSYQSALEKQDAEELSMLKANQETAMLGLIKEIKQLQIQEATKNREGLEKTKEVTQTRFDYYAELISTGLIDNEKQQLDRLRIAKDRQDEASYVEITASIAHAVPNFNIPGPGFSLGGSNVGSALNAWAKFINHLGSGYTYEANGASITGTNERRAIDWSFQQKAAGKELIQIDKQILSSKIREDVSTKELSNQEQLIENAQITEEFLRNKFSNQELYGWTIGEMATCYFPYYQLVYAWAKTAERLYRFELGITSSNFITFGYWDSFRKGLMAGEKLQLALKQMEKSYLDLNKRDYEITKHISLLQTNPLALLTLKETGSCIIELPEYLFDMDYPGQYMRKIKNVSISIPCVIGPYTSINCTLTLLKSKLRLKNILQGGKYEEGEDDPRFETRLSACNSIATSHAQNDTGMFDLNFRDERFLPFEGAGAISRWEIRLPKETNQFNTDTISDIILQLKYTAKEGGMALSELAMNEVKKNFKTGTRLFSLKHDFPNEWHRFLNTPLLNSDQVLKLDIKPDHFPYLVGSNNLKITNIIFFADSKLASIPELTITSPGNNSNQYKFSKVSIKYGPLFIGHPASEWAIEDVGIWKLVKPLTNPNKLDKDNCNDIIAIVSFQIM